MYRLEVSAAVRHIYMSLGFKRLILHSHLRLDLSSGLSLSCFDTKTQYILGYSSPNMPHVPSLILCDCMHCKPPVFTVPHFRTAQSNGPLNPPTTQLGANCNNLQKFELAFPLRSTALSVPANSAHVQYARNTRWGCYPPFPSQPPYSNCSNDPMD